MPSQSMPPNYVSVKVKFYLAPELQGHISCKDTSLGFVASKRVAATRESLLAEISRKIKPLAATNSSLATASRLLQDTDHVRVELSRKSVKLARYVGLKGTSDFRALKRSLNVRDTLKLYLAFYKKTESVSSTEDREQLRSYVHKKMPTSSIVTGVMGTAGTAEAAEAAADTDGEKVIRVANDSRESDATWNAPRYESLLEEIRDHRHHHHSKRTSSLPVMTKDSPAVLPHIPTMEDQPRSTTPKGTPPPQYTPVTGSSSAAAAPPPQYSEAEPKLPSIDEFLRASSNSNNSYLSAASAAASVLLQSDMGRDVRKQLKQFSSELSAGADATLKKLQGRIESLEKSYSDASSRSSEIDLTSSVNTLKQQLDSLRQRVSDIETTGCASIAEEPASQSVPRHTASPVVHSTIICDACDNTIVGNRYKCVECNDFDLCEKCELANKECLNHRSTHQMLKIKLDEKPLLPLNAVVESACPYVTGRSLYHRASRRNRRADSEQCYSEDYPFGHPCSTIPDVPSFGRSYQAPQGPPPSAAAQAPEEDEESSLETARLLSVLDQLEAEEGKDKVDLLKQLVDEYNAKKSEDVVDKSTSTDTLASVVSEGTSPVVAGPKVLDVSCSTVGRLLDVKITNKTSETLDRPKMDVHFKLGSPVSDISGIEITPNRMEPGATRNLRIDMLEYLEFGIPVSKYTLDWVSVIDIIGKTVYSGKIVDGEGKLEKQEESKEEPLEKSQEESQVAKEVKAETPVAPVTPEVPATQTALTVAAPVAAAVATEKIDDDCATLKGSKEMNESSIYVDSLSHVGSVFKAPELDMDDFVVVTSESKDQSSDDESVETDEDYDILSTTDYDEEGSTVA